jgi:hypothetical protein
MLGIFLLGDAHGLALAIEQDGARTGGALVEGEDVLRHVEPPEWPSVRGRNAMHIVH